MHTCMGCGKTIDAPPSEYPIGWIRAQVIAYFEPFIDGGASNTALHNIISCSIQCMEAAADASEPEGVPLEYETKGTGLYQRERIVNRTKNDNAGGPAMGSHDREEMQANGLTNPAEYHSLKIRHKLKKPSSTIGTPAPPPDRIPGKPVGP